MFSPMQRLTASTLAFLLLSSALPPARAAEGGYSDTADHWAAEVIDKATQYGLMTGYPDGRFGVGDNMTRAEFATVLCRLFGWEMTALESPSYIDCSPTAWYYAAVETLTAHQAADAGGSFRPEDPISRGEMAEMLVRSLGYTSLARSLSEVELPFPDVAEGRGYIAIAYDLGIITGVEEQGELKFLPTFSAPREQAAAMLVRCYERYTAQTDFLHGFYATSSYSQLSYTDTMDAVSVGWARLEADSQGTPSLNQTSTGGNGWVLPEGSELVTDYLTERSIPCNLCVFGTAATFSSLTAADAQDAAIEQLVTAAQSYAGLTIDIEGLKTASRADFTRFMTALRSALPADQLLYVCVQPDTWYGGFDYRSLGEVCNKVILMAHDYQWSSIPEYYLGTTNTDCPVTPFDQVYTALRHITDPDTGVQDRSKLALAISFNTTGFHVDEEGKLLDTTFYHPSTATIAQRLQQPDSVRTWDEVSHNPYLEYTTEEGSHYKLWYEDAQSVADKLQLARMFGITGVSVWRLGTIPAESSIPNYDVWCVLSNR